MGLSSAKPMRWISPQRHSGKGDLRHTVQKGLRDYGFFLSCSPTLPGPSLSFSILSSMMASSALTRSNLSRSITSYSSSESTLNGVHFDSAIRRQNDSEREESARPTLVASDRWASTRFRATCPMRPNKENMIVPGSIFARPPFPNISLAGQQFDSKSSLSAAELPPATPPAMQLAEIGSRGLVFLKSLAWSIKLRVAEIHQHSIKMVMLRRCWPQNVLPKANHCIPEARANKVGVVDRSTPETPPTRRPDVPMGWISIRGLWLSSCSEWDPH